jgi:hypothetical protein
MAALAAGPQGAGAVDEAQVSRKLRRMFRMVRMRSTIASLRVSAPR